MELSRPVPSHAPVDDSHVEALGQQVAAAGADL
jgi:hypothetical protein